MSDYRAPLREMMFAIRELAGLDRIAALPGAEEVNAELAGAVLEEAAALAEGVIAPTNVVGDREGTRVEGGRVIVPAGFADAYREFAAGGWPGMTAPARWGGQDLPFVVGVAVEEMWCSANLAWSLGPLLTAGAVRTIDEHGDDRLRETYLPKMVAGAWSGTMNLTEPQAGSDLAAVRTQAVRDGDRYRLSGQKIFITWGDHEMTENIIHLVLARLPDAPSGSRGISLFIVPKFLPGEDGEPGERNSVRTVSVEHKLGIHGSPTCVMAFEEAIGFMLGRPNEGLASMFTMMNHARLGVGLEGVAIAERACQKAVAYARERVQGRVPGEKGRVPIIRHADVRRMLLTMKASIEAMRGIAYVAAAELDLAERHPDDEARATHRARVDLLTPVVKGWCTELAQQLTSLGLQVHGGMGYVEETGAAQFLRDARITTIYEGTTGIQANDLVGRKILRDEGRALGLLLDEMRGLDAALASHESLASIRDAHARGCDTLAAARDWLLANHARHPAAPGAASWHLLMLLGTVTGGWQLARGALAATLAGTGPDADVHRARITMARFYAEQLMPQAEAHRQALEAGPETLYGLDDDQF